MTGGGNTGTEYYKPSYFLNLCTNTKRIFGDDFIGIYSVYGCPRAINYKNSTEVCHFANDGIITYGKGGTGNTKRHIEAVNCLMDLGYTNEIVKFFNERLPKLGEMIHYGHKEHKKCFYHDNRKKIFRRMGYGDGKLTVSEKILLSIIPAFTLLGSIFFFSTI
jgi:hypothetical protein